MLRAPFRLLIAYIVLCLVACQSNSEHSLKSHENSEPVLENVTFAGSQSCRSCHPSEYKNWKGSHHQLAMQKATYETVLADFNTSVTFNGVTSTFRTENDAFKVNTIGRDGQSHEYQVIYTFGVTPLQQYIVAFPDGSYQCLQTAWDSKQNKWFDLQPDLKIAPDEWLHWTGNGMKWNTACADCHSTNVQKNFDQKLKIYHTTYSEINVSCEACHGPSSSHVSFYEQKKTGTPPVLYMKNGMTGPELVQKCARCHSRRTQLTSFFDYEGDYLDHYEPQLITTPIYEADGQIRDEDYVYGSFIQSKMYAKGVSCRDCHDMHSMQLKAFGNTLCLQCHQSSYDTPEHHFHAVESNAAQCINCHMTGKTYMGNDFRRDHSFRIPRPDQSVVYGTPNACNGCHTDKSTNWAAEKVTKWYGPKRKDHFSDHLLAGVNGEKSELFFLLEHQEYPEIARASAASNLTSTISTEDATKIKKYLNDSSVLVRNEVVKLIGAIHPQDGNALLAGSLNDPVRMIRINAVEIFNLWGAENTTSGYQKANSEYWDMLKMNADFPGGQQRIANYYQAKGEMNQAIAAYEEALRIDNYDNMTRMNLALLKYQLGKVTEAESLYLEVIQKEPEASYPYYMLGLLYNEQNEPLKAQNYMEKACSKEPYLERAYYNYAIMLQQQQKYKESLQLLKTALIKGGNNQEGIHYMKLLAEINLHLKSEAVKSARKLVDISNNNPRYVSILKSLNE